MNLSIWKIEKKLHKDNKYCSKSKILLNRVEIYSTISKFFFTIIIFKQDLMTFYQHEHQKLLDIKMNIIFSNVYAIAKEIVEQMKKQQ